MAKLGIIANFEANHGSKKIRKDKFTIELIINGTIKNGFVAEQDYVKPKIKLNELIKELSEKYLDDIVGRATNENIAKYVMFNLRNLCPQSIKIYENKDIYVEITLEDFDLETYPSELEYALGHSFLLRENPKKAEEHLTKAISLNPLFAEAYNLRGRCFKYMNNFERALADFIHTVNINPYFGEAWRNLGNTYLYLGKFKEMTSAFDKSVELMPNSALAINNRGYSHFLNKNYALALSDHERAITIDPNYAEAHYDKAMALKALGRDKEAQETLLIFETLKKNGEDTYHEIKMY